MENQTNNKMMNNSHFLAFLFRMKYINRWSLMRNTEVENIAEHSLQVAMIAHILAVIKNKYYGGNLDPNYIAVLAIFHDSSEIITGDMPTPVKYFNPELKEAYKNVEYIANQKLVSMLPEDFKEIYQDIFFHNESEEWSIVKAADKLAAYIKCIEEEKAGNKEFVKAKETISKSIDAIERPEVKYFMDIFMRSFSLTLDELEY
ncbi:5'-deoxynucleotidase [Acetivibrio straminisolvens]|jgi:5'-deoxynucleotidase|uniref:Nucleotidase YfbR n=1 Tax=Acetivibrio straminisolvens JCM 21531 TaxID=1294263 RepID=W4VCW6_9FIRM|nr:5'-deoxynucleotidase [Acetivibrio straminisolvens]GAE91042.1 nucleotidase YfbR [Acetivibrio straminisolvens JCM 21531]